MVTLFHCWNTRIKTNEKRINTNGRNSVGAYWHELTPKGIHESPLHSHQQWE